MLTSLETAAQTSLETSVQKSLETSAAMSRDVRTDVSGEVRTDVSRDARTDLSCIMEPREDYRSRFRKTSMLTRERSENICGTFEAILFRTE